MAISIKRILRPDVEFVKRNFYRFRVGHSTYLIFFISFMQFVIVSYSLYITGHPSLLTIFPTVYHWITFFLLTYLPASILVGYFHMKKQLPTEARQATENNPYTFQASPGKESLYNLPATVIGYDLQLKNMNIHNQTCEFYKKTFGYEIERWTKADFEHIEKLKEIAVRLQRGESITDIIGSSQLKNKKPCIFWKDCIYYDPVKPECANQLCACRECEIYRELKKKIESG